MLRIRLVFIAKRSSDDDATLRHMASESSLLELSRWTHTERGAGVGPWWTAAVRAIDADDPARSRLLDLDTQPEVDAMQRLPTTPWHADPEARWPSLSVSFHLNFAKAPARGSFSGWMRSSTRASSGTSSPSTLSTVPGKRWRQGLKRPDEMLNPRIDWEPFADSIAIRATGVLPTAVELSRNAMRKGRAQPLEEHCNGLRILRRSIAGGTAWGARL